MQQVIQKLTHWTHPDQEHAWLGPPGTVARNIVPACVSCNSSKKNVQPMQRLRRKFGKQAADIEQRIKAYFEQIENTWKTE